MLKLKSINVKINPKDFYKKLNKILGTVRWITTP